MNKFVKGLVAVGFGILAVLALAPVFGHPVPDTIWGMVIASIVNIVGLIVPAGKEAFKFEIPANYKASIDVKIREEHG